MTARHRTDRRGRFHLFIRFSVALAVALLSVPLLGPSGSYADEAAATGAQEDEPKKVVVCKFVRKPHSDEVEHHVVIVGASALEEGFAGTFPFEFEDAHGQSMAVRWAEKGEQSHDLDVAAECPGEEPPSEEPPGEEPPGEEPPGEEPPGEEPPGEDPPGEEDPKKVVVCKYVKKPHTDEILSHIIIVSVNALGDGFTGTFPHEFADEHEGSVAIRYAEDGEKAGDFDAEETAALCDGPTDDLTVLKRDFETSELLAGAGFTLYLDNAPVGELTAADEVVGTAVSNGDGAALFDDLEHGAYLVEETSAPEGYSLPDEAVQSVVIDGPGSTLTFLDVAEGQLAIVAKQQLELVDGSWVPSDGVIDFGEQVKYVVQVAASGPKLFHDVTVTDYVPGFNPADTTSTAEASLVPGSAQCTGSLVCAVTVSADGLVTWSMGTVQDASGAVEMIVEFPELPDQLPVGPGETFTATLWNVGFLDWNEVTGLDAQARLARGMSVAPGDPACPLGFTCTPHELASNEVVIRASVQAPPGGVLPPPGEPQGGEVTTGGVLPATGADSELLRLLLTGLLALAFGTALVARTAVRTRVPGRHVAGR